MFVTDPDGSKPKTKMKQDTSINVRLEGEEKKSTIPETGAVDLRIYRTEGDRFHVGITHYNNHLPVESTFWLTKEGIAKLGTQCVIAPFTGDEEEK